MTDREMLELAAKAAGYKCAWSDSRGGFYFGLGSYTPEYWDPLSTDGHALRLAAKLKIDIEWQSTGPLPEPNVEAYQRNAEGSSFCASEHEDNYRRAIVRAAAELGKAMP